MTSEPIHTEDGHWECGVCGCSHQNWSGAKMCDHASRRRLDAHRENKKEAKVGIIKMPGRLYFVDKDGDISSCEMVRGRKKKKRK